MSDEPLALLSQLIGLTGYETKAYLGLLQQHPVTGYELSKVCGVPQSKIYETLKRLEMKGMAVRVAGQTAQYIPLSTDQLVHRIRQDCQEKIDKVDQLFRSFQNAKSSDYVWNLKTLPIIMNKADELVNLARVSLCISIWAEDFARFERALRRAAYRKVKILIVSHEEIDFPLGECIHHQAEEDVLADRGRELVVCADDKIVLVSCTSGEEPQGVWTANVSLVKIIKEFVLHEAALWRMFYDLGPENLENRYGKGLRNLMHV